MSRAAFEARFPDEAACSRHLAAMRWPDGFVCPACGHGRGWELKRRRASWECAACGKETSVSAGTVMHRSHLPLKTWFMAAHIVTSHSNGISHLRRYLDEFVFRWNRRCHTATAFDTLLGIGTRLQPAGYRDIVGQRA